MQHGKIAFINQKLCAIAPHADCRKQGPVSAHVGQLRTRCCGSLAALGCAAKPRLSGGRAAVAATLPSRAPSGGVNSRAVRGLHARAQGIRFRFWLDSSVFRF